MMAHDSGYAAVNGLEIYYEIHGSGEPLLVLPGAFMTVELMGDLVPALAKHRQVIAVEFQGHGHTADIDRPFSYEAFADDTAALLDIWGSLGRRLRVQPGRRRRTATRAPAPDRVRKLVIASASYSSGGMYPEVLGGIENITPEMFDGTPWRDAYSGPRPTRRRSRRWSRNSSSST